MTKDVIEVVSGLLAAFFAYYYGIKFAISAIKEKEHK